MTVQGSLFLQPTGATPQQLYQALKNLIDTLNRQSSSGATLPPGVQDALDDVQNQIDNIVANGDLTPQQAFELSLVTRADEIFGSITGLMEQQKTQMQQNADATMQAAIQAAKANTGVRTTVRVMNEQNIALAERIDTVEADLGVTNANVTDLTQAVSDGDSALASSISSVSSTVAGNTAAIAVVTQSINGVSQQFAVTFNSQGEVTGSIRLDGNQQRTQFVVNADGFLVGKAGTNGGNPINAFAIDIVNGVPQIALRGNIIADASISARTIQAGSITADKISANALSAISANLGTVTAGLIQNPAGTLLFNLPAMQLYRADGTFTIDLSNKVIDITF
jgi:hypothetical protein